MEITICSQNEIDFSLDYEEPPIDCIISIIDPGQHRPPRICQYKEWMLPLQFDDVWEGVEEEGDILPDEEDIDDVLDFVERCVANNKSHLLIHCYQGISRSAAIAVIVYAYLDEGNPYKQVLRIRQDARPNPLILDLGEQVLGKSLLNGELAHE